MKLKISLDEKELIIKNEEREKELIETVGKTAVHEYSQVPEFREGDEKFNRLRKVALHEWYIRANGIIQGIIFNLVDK